MKKGLLFFSGAFLAIGLYLSVVIYAFIKVFGLFYILTSAYYFNLYRQEIKPKKAKKFLYIGLALFIISLLLTIGYVSYLASAVIYQINQ